jgi:hypothetical protein
MAEAMDERQEERLRASRDPDPEWRQARRAAHRISDKNVLLPRLRSLRKKPFDHLV